MVNPAIRSRLVLIVVLFGMLANLGPGLAAIDYNLPLYLDVIGTITVTLLCGWQVGAAVGVFSSFEGGLINPHMPYFAFTHITIAAITGCCARHGWFKNPLLIMLTGLLIGIAAAIVSAPAVAIAFADPAGAQSGFAGFCSGTLEHLRASFASADIWKEPVDKILQCLIAAGIIEALPKSLLAQLDSPAGYLRSSEFL